MSEQRHDPADYTLSAEENRRIFLQEIVPDQMQGARPVPSSVAVFIAGQQGAGKSRVTAMVAVILNAHGGFVDIDSDLYKPYHPEYDALMARSDTQMATLTGPDGRAWTAQAHQYARRHGLNALVQTTSQGGEALAGIMREYREAGFRLEMLVLAVPKAMSDLGIVARYHEQVKDRGSGRLTPRRNAERSYQGLLDLADLVDRDRLVDQVGVYRRGEAVPRYANALNDDGGWQQPPTLRAALEAERLRPWTESETIDFLRLSDRLRAEMGPVWKPVLDSIERSATPLMRNTSTFVVRAAVQVFSPSDRRPMQPRLGPATAGGGLAPPLPRRPPEAGPEGGAER